MSRSVVRKRKEERKIPKGGGGTERFSTVWDRQGFEFIYAEGRENLSFREPRQR
jgi:hypothetical protein